MVAVIIKKNTCPDNNYLLNACRYVLDERAIAPGGFGVSAYSAETAYAQMKAVREYFNKDSMNPLIHIIISYDNAIPDLTTASAITRVLAQNLAVSNQVLYCTHAKGRGCSCFHAYILINAVSYGNGAIFNSSIPIMQEYCKFVSLMLGQPCRLFFD